MDMSNSQRIDLPLPVVDRTGITTCVAHPAGGRHAAPVKKKRTLPMLTVRCALVADIASISDLLMANAAERGGQLYGDWSVAVVKGWMEVGALILVAAEGGKTVGVLFTSEKAQASAPPVRAMLLAWPGSTDAFVYGPVCIDTTARGCGVLQALYSELVARRSRREALLFIKAGNDRSLRAHEKLGLKKVTSFFLDHDEFIVLSSTG